VEPPEGLKLFAEDFEALGRKVEYFVTARLLEGTPSVWNDQIDYMTWRHIVAEQLTVDPAEVQLVGSAKLGYSLNPGKNFTKFHDESDFDIAIISNSLFEKAWAELRSLIQNGSFDGRRNNLRKLVFEECVALDIVLPHMSFGKTWSKGRDALIASLGEGFGSRTVNYRLYRSHRALRSYQIKSVEAAESRAVEDGIL
jgi:hypothetical protein